MPPGEHCDLRHAKENDRARASARFLCIYTSLMYVYAKRGAVTCIIYTRMRSRKEIEIDANSSVRDSRSPDSNHFIARSLYRLSAVPKTRLKLACRVKRKERK